FAGVSTAALDLGVGHDRVDDAMLGEPNAFGQLDVGDVQHGATDHFSEVDFNGLGQIGRQAGDFDFGDGVSDHGSRQLHGRRDVAGDAVTGHLGGDAPGLVYALVIDVQNLLLVG